MTHRYLRQQQVPQLGVRSQALLANAKVLIVGAGGLGAPVSTLLVGAGVGKITLVDHDKVSLSNLHRQTLFTEADVDRPKVIAAQKRLQASNADVQINVVNGSLCIENAEALVTEHTVVVDAADSFFVSYLLSDYCLKHRIPLVAASVLQTSGYVGVFCGTHDKPASSIRAIFPTPPLAVKSCSTAGVTGPSVGIVGAIQAQEVLKVVMQDDSQLLGKLLYLDLWDYRQNIVDFEGAPEPGRYAALIAENELLETDSLLDVRSPEEVNESPRERSFINISVDQINARYKELNTETRIVCVCRSGQRALNAAHQLIELGCKSIAVAL